ncbi:MAG TPA: DUF3667 domain-containing protein [Williamwhitmania sp.]|nr:DUF3667 domain-containing protein [Williamwhitmania sp.]
MQNKLSKLAAKLPSLKKVSPKKSIAEPNTNSTQPHYCLNCGALLVGPYCHNCGQKGESSIKPFKEAFVAIAENNFNFDSKLIHTIIPFIFKPGKLSKEYVEGKRASYIAPIKLYFFCSLVFFGLLSMSSIKSNMKVKNGNEVKTGIALSAIADSIDRDSALNSDASTRAFKETLVHSLKEIPGKQEEHIKKGEEVNSSAGLSAFANVIDKDTTLSKDTYGRVLKRTLVSSLKDIPGTKKKIIQTANYMMLALLPVFALLLMMTYSRRKKYFVEHMVLSTHLHCFFYLFLSISMVLSMLHLGYLLPGWVAFLILVAYTFFALKQFYGGRNRTTFFRMLFLAVVYPFVLIVASVLAIVGAIGVSVYFG